MEGSDLTGYQRTNSAKANFDSIYTAPTPHAYFESLRNHGYEISSRAAPYCAEASKLPREFGEQDFPVQILDVGCSYGIVSATAKYGRSFDEMGRFLAARVPRDYAGACQETRKWLAAGSPPRDVEFVGLDSSAPAIRFAVDTGLLKGGIVCDLERPEATLTPKERSIVGGCHMLVSTGAIGYITDRTLDAVLQHLGRGHASGSSPIAVVTILRMFDPVPIRRVFEDHGFEFGPVSGAHLPQRSFANRAERQNVLKLLHARDIDTRGLEDRGKHIANLFIAARRERFPDLLERMEATLRRQLAIHSPTSHDD